MLGQHHQLHFSCRGVLSCLYLLTINKYFQCCDFENMQKDVEKLKDELNSKDIKIKWTQNKLKSEIENHKVIF